MKNPIIQIIWGLTNTENRKHCIRPCQSSAECFSFDCCWINEITLNITHMIFIMYKIKFEQCSLLSRKYKHSKLKFKTVCLVMLLTCNPGQMSLICDFSGRTAKSTDLLHNPVPQICQLGSWGFELMIFLVKEQLRSRWVFSLLFNCQKRSSWSLQLDLFYGQLKSANSKLDQRYQ